MELYDPPVGVNAGPMLAHPPKVDAHSGPMSPSRESSHAATTEPAPTGPKKWYPYRPMPT